MINGSLAEKIFFNVIPTYRDTIASYILNQVTRPIFIYCHRRATGCNALAIGYMGYHSVTCHLTQVITPCRNPSYTGWYLLVGLYPEGWKAELTQVTGDWLVYVLRWFTRPHTVTHPSRTRQ